MNQDATLPAKTAIDRLMAKFFQTVSFETDSTPAYEAIHDVFIAPGLLIKNTGSSPEISSLRQFVAPRREMVLCGELTRFSERELHETTLIFGNVAHRFSAYEKSGVSKGQPFAAKGMISTQFISTPTGWRISAMAWDDERPGLAILSDSNPGGQGACHSQS